MSRLHKPKAGFWLRLCAIVIFPFTTLLYRTKWQHLDRMPAPEQGGVIIALNHVSQLDTLLMARMLWSTGRLPRFMIKAGVFSWPGVKYIMRGTKQIPVYRGTADAAESLRAAVAALEQGEAVVIYPEGTTTKDPANWPMRAKTGVARLVLLSPDTPVVPVGQWGAHHLRDASALTKALKTIARRKVVGRVGEPLDLSRYRGAEPTGETLREITDVIMSAIRDEVAILRGEPAPTEFFVPTRKYVDRAGSPNGDRNGDQAVAQPADTETSA